jgi:Zn-finger nucleic acid-binding protein
MKPLKSVIVIGGLLLTLLVFLPGCSSSQKSGTAEADTGMNGMMCPKCETVWVAEKKGSYSKVSRLAYRREMVCPDCNAMAESVLLEDGKVQLHDCPDCKVTPKPIKPIERPRHYIPKKGIQG